MTKFLKKILWSLLFFYFGLCPYPVSALDAVAPVGEVSLHCRLNGGRIGDPITFVIQVRLKASAVLEPSSLSRLELRPLDGNGKNLQKEFFEFEFAAFDHLKLAAKKNFTIRGVMRFYTPGEYHLAPLSLLCRLADSGDKPVTWTIVSNSIGVRIAALHPESEPKPALVIPAKEPRFMPTGLAGWSARSRLYQYAIFTSSLLTLFFGIICYFRRKNSPPLPLNGNVDPITEVTQALAATLKQVEVENHWRYLVGLDHLLRKFFIAKLKLAAARDGGSGGAFVEQILPALDASMATRLQALWLEIDQIIAQEIKGDPGFAKLRQELQDWLRAYVGEKGARYGV